MSERASDAAELRDKDELAAFLRRDRALYAYHLGDLDDFFWPFTRWWGTRDEQGALREVALLYGGGTLLALSRDPAAMQALVRGVAPELPARLYAHLSPGVLPALEERWRSEPRGPHLKMRLAHPQRLARVDVSSATQLGPGDADELLGFYARVYPGNWFDPRMLETGTYFGLREGRRLLSVAGIHVVSRAFGVAALGNIATDREARGRGLARITTAAVCRALREGGIEEIGLNVHASNRAALACYERLGFRTCAEYEEHELA